MEHPDHRASELGHSLDHSRLLEGGWRNRHSSRIMLLAEHPSCSSTCSIVTHLATTDARTPGVVRAVGAPPSAGHDPHAMATPDGRTCLAPLAGLPGNRLPPDRGKEKPILFLEGVPVTDRPDARGPAMDMDACLPLAELSSKPSRSCKRAGTALCEKLHHVMAGTAVRCHVPTCPALEAKLAGTQVGGFARCRLKGLPGTGD